MTDKALADRQLVGRDKHPLIALVQWLHREHDGYLSLHARTSGVFGNLGSINPGRISTTPPAFWNAIASDAFLSINGFWSSGFGRPNRRLGLDHAFRGTKHLRWLNAAFVDLDCYRQGLTPARAVDGLMAQAEGGMIPKPSGLLYSGRGVWGLWRLDAGSGQRSERAWPERVELYIRVQRRLSELCRELGSDPAARDPARVMRIPGSENPKSNSIVHWTTTVPSGGSVGFALGELADRLRIRMRKRWAAKPRRSVSADVSERKRKGWMGLQRSRIEGVEALERLRGGFPEGMRNRAAFLYAGSLWRAEGKPALETLYPKVRALGDRCRPPLGDREVRKAVRSAPQLERITNETIADWLSITPAEAEKIERFGPASEYRAEHAAAHPSRRAKAASRRSALRAVLGSASEVACRRPSLRELRAYLNELGLAASISTIRRDCESIDHAAAKDRIESEQEAV